MRARDRDRERDKKKTEKKRERVRHCGRKRMKVDDGDDRRALVWQQHTILTFQRSLFFFFSFGPSTCTSAASRPIYEHTGYRNVRTNIPQIFGPFFNDISNQKIFVFTTLSVTTCSDGVSIVPIQAIYTSACPFLISPHTTHRRQLIVSRKLYSLWLEVYRSARYDDWLPRFVKFSRTAKIRKDSRGILALPIPMYSCHALTGLRSWSINVSLSLSFQERWKEPTTVAHHRLAIVWRLYSVVLSREACDIPLPSHSPFRRGTKRNISKSSSRGGDSWDATRVERSPYGGE